MSEFRRAVGQLGQSITTDSIALQRSLSPRPVGIKAEDRAFRLLIDNLSPSQREQYQAYGHFDVVGGDTGKIYRIWHGFQMNVEELDHEGGHARLWCFLPTGYVPVGDVMLTQKIALESFEREAMLVAHRYSRPEDMHAELTIFSPRNRRR